MVLLLIGAPYGSYLYLKSGYEYRLQSIEELKPGDLIKIIKAYVKSDLSGSPTINVGSGSSIEPSDVSSDIPSIESLTRDVRDEPAANLVASDRAVLVIDV